MSELVGQTLGHYRVVEKVSEGGMGEVYRLPRRRQPDPRQLMIVGFFIY